jgi:hypothetical protein
VRLSFRWWVAPYLSALDLLCESIGTEADEGTVVEFLVKYGIKITPA